jgi:AraC family transcriptional regulator
MQHGEQDMQLNEPGRDGPLGPRERARFVSFAPSAASDWRGRVGMLAARYRNAPATEVEVPPSTHHSLVLVHRPSEECEIRYEDVKRHIPPPAGSILVIPAGIPVRWRWNGQNDSLHVSLEPGLVAQVAAASFDLDPARVAVPPLDQLYLPPLRAAMVAVDTELTAGGAGGSLAAESLANVLAVHLIRHVSTPRRPERGGDGKLPRGRLRAVVEYIEEHLDAGVTLEQMAAVARLSPYHFARQFKKATGLPPYQYVILRRVERAKQLLQAQTGLSLAEVAALAGFSDQSQFSNHFKRVLGVTPGQFRISARIA